jgi:hypothetical protein
VATHAPRVPQHGALGERHDDRTGLKYRLDVGVVRRGVAPGANAPLDIVPDVLPLPPRDEAVKGGAGVATAVEQRRSAGGRRLGVVVGRLGICLGRNRHHRAGDDEAQQELAHLLSPFLSVYIWSKLSL